MQRRATEIPFKFELPVEVWEKAGEPGKERRIGGIITSEDKDRQGEVVLQRGLDFSEFIDHGWFNDNHSKETTGIVGYPDLVEKRVVKGRPTHYVEGYLIPDYEKADEIWKLAQSLQKTNRRLGFSIEGSVIRREGLDGKIIAEAKVRNVAITNCFPGDTLVCGAGENVTRRLYSGPMIEIHLATGEKLTGTPNHPVFTQRGWIALGELNEVHDRIGRVRGDGMAAPGISHHVDHIPSMLEEIFDLALLAGSTSWVCPARERQFHGDGRGGEVNVVPIYRQLRDGLKATFLKQFGQDALVAADKQASFLADAGFQANFFVARESATACFVGGMGEGLSLIGGPGPVASDLFLTPGSGEAIPLGDVVDGHASDIMTGGDCGRILSSAVGFSNLTFKRRFEFRGHVFNLDTQYGWYGANGIIAHNCPVNTSTGLEILAKSMMSLEAEGSADKSGDCWSKGTCCGECEAHDVDKALTAGQAIANPGAVPGAGFALRTESLESQKKLTKVEAIEWLQSRYRGLSKADAERIYRHAAKAA